MKKYIKFMAFAMMAVFSFAFVSCDDDEDDGPSTGGNIIGTWKCDLALDFDKEDDLFAVEEYHSYLYSQYKEDGTLINVYVYILF